MATYGIMLGLINQKDRMCLFGSFAASYAKEISNEDHSLVIDKLYFK